MKCNKDEGKTLFQAIDAVDDKYLVETLEDMQKRKGQNHKQQFKQMTPMVRNKCYRGSSDIQDISTMDSKDIYATDHT